MPVLKMNPKKGTSMPKGMEGLLKHFHFTKLLKPMLYAILFSVVYNLGYLWISSYLNGVLYNILSILWLSLYGLSWYFVSTIAFGKKRGVLSPQKAALVTLWLLAWNVLASLIIVPLYNLIGLHGSNGLLMIVIQLIAALVLIFMVPVTILFFRAVYDGTTKLKQLSKEILQSIQEHASFILNSWLVLFILMVVWDSLFSGPLTIYFGLNGVHMMMQLLYLGNPMAYWMLLLSAAGGGVTSGYAYAIFLNVLISLLFNFLDLNLIVYIGQFIKKEQKQKSRR